MLKYLRRASVLGISQTTNTKPQFQTLKITLNPETLKL